MVEDVRMDGLEGNDDDEQGMQPGLFDEPEGYYQPEKPAGQASHTLLSGETVTLQLVGHDPLWGHLLWNSGRTVADYLEERADELVKDKNILELGAGAGLPSLICARRSARKVVVTDYPDPRLVENLRYNVSKWACKKAMSNIYVEGYLWGAETDKICSHLDEPLRGFDLLILADVLFNHSEHGRLVSTVARTLKRAGASKALVFFTPYRPWLLKQDVAFFDLAEKAGLKVDKIFEHVMEKVMFEGDPGDELLRRTVFGYELHWNSVKGE